MKLTNVYLPDTVYNEAKQKYAPKHMGEVFKNINILRVSVASETYFSCTDRSFALKEQNF